MAKYYTHGEVLIARRMFKSGAKSREVAEVLGRSLSSISAMRRTRAKRDRSWLAREKREYTAKEVQNILAWSLAGLKAREIAERLGRTVKAINQQIAIARRKANKRRYPAATFKAGELAAWVRKLSIPGVPDADIAAILGTSRLSVTKCRIRLGIPRRYFGGGAFKRVHPVKSGEFVSPERRKALVIRWHARFPEMTAVAIAANVDYSERNVRRILRDLGISDLRADRDLAERHAMRGMTG